MKKISKRVAGLLFAGAFAITGLTGCSGIQNIENNNEGIIYNGSVASVGDYLFFANGFASDVSGYSKESDSEYNVAKEYSYLARTNKADYEGTKFENSTEVNKLSDRIAGYSSMYMFVLGDYIYYATPNTHKTSENKFVWQYVSIFRCGLDGSKGEEIYTTKAYDESKWQIRALSQGDKHFLVIYDGTNLVRIDLSGKTSSKVISNAVTSIAIPSENENWNGEIYFTEERNSAVGQTGNLVYKASVIDGNKGNPVCQENGLTITFTGRAGNDLFFTREENGIKETYTIDLDTKGNKTFATAGKLFYSLEISNVYAIAQSNALYEGIVFTTTKSDSTQVMYYNNFQAGRDDDYIAEVFVETGFSDKVVIFEENFYYSTSDGIMKKSVLGGESVSIVNGMTITSQKGCFGYDYYYVDGKPVGINNIYFFATHVYDESAEDYSADDATDQSIYLYGVDANGVRDPKLFSKVK